MSKSATSHLKGLAKSHRIALSPTDRQATLADDGACRLGAGGGQLGA